MFKNYSWDWGVFFEPVATGAPTNYLGWLLQGLHITVVLVIFASAIALVVGIVMGVLRTVPNRALAALGAIYVAIFRNIPVVVQLFAWYFVFPDVAPWGIGKWFIQLPAPTQMMASSVIGLGLYMGARVCEHIRSGVRTLSRGQGAAALALGLTRPQAYRYVLVPVAIRVAIPILASELVNVIKNSAVASTIGLLELTAQSQQLVYYTDHAFESFAAVTLTYMVLNLLALAITRRIEKTLQVPGYIGGK